MLSKYKNQIVSELYNKEFDDFFLILYSCMIEANINGRNINEIFDSNY